MYSVVLRKETWAIENGIPSGNPVQPRVIESDFGQRLARLGMAQSALGSPLILRID